MSAIGKILDRLVPKTKIVSPSSINANNTSSASTSKRIILKESRPMWKGTEYIVKEPTDIIASLMTRFNVSKEYACNLIKNRQCRLNNKPILRGNTKLHPRDTVHLPFKLLRFAENKGEDKVQVLYRDKELLFINKPPSLAVHGGHKVQRKDTLQQWLDKNFEEQGEQKPFMLHRLDKDASGVLMLALTKEAATKWSKIISETLVDPTKIVKRVILSIFICSIGQSILVNRRQGETRSRH